MALNRSDKSRILRRYFPGMTRNSEMSTEPSLRLTSQVQQHQRGQHEGRQDFHSSHNRTSGTGGQWRARSFHNFHRRLYYKTSSCIPAFAGMTRNQEDNHAQGI